MPTPYQFAPMPDDVAQQIVARARAAIQAVRAGGMRSPDVKVRLATIAMPLTAETYEDRIKAQHRLMPVLDAYERAWQHAYRLCIGKGMTDAESRAEASRFAAPVRKEVDTAIVLQRRQLDAVVETNRRRKLAAERAAAQKAGFR